MGVVLLSDLSETEDIDDLGDKIDAACPSKADIDEEESDEEKRGWRSEKKSEDTPRSNHASVSKKRSLPTRRSPIRSPPKRRIAPPLSPVPRRSRNRYDVTSSTEPNYHQSCYVSICASAYIVRLECF